MNGLELQGGTKSPLLSHPNDVWVLPSHPNGIEQDEEHQSLPQQHEPTKVQHFHRPPGLVNGSRKPRWSSMALLKLSLMAFSFVFWAAGIAMLIVGIWAKLLLEEYLVLSTNNYPNTPLILLCCGGAVILWGFLGCFSAAVEKRCLLRTYGLFQLSVLLTGLAAGLSGLFYRKDIAEGFQTGLQNAVLSYAENEEKADALDDVQRALQCCGVHNYRDWLESPWSLEQQEQHQIFLGKSNNSVPSSCCRVRRGCHNNPLLPGAPGIHWDGCFKKVSDFVSDNMFYIATAALGLALLQVVGIVLTCLLAARIPYRVPETVPT